MATIFLEFLRLLPPRSTSRRASSYLAPSRLISPRLILSRSVSPSSPASTRLVTSRPLFLLPPFASLLPHPSLHCAIKRRQAISNFQTPPNPPFPLTHLTHLTHLKLMQLLDDPTLNPFPRPLNHLSSAIYSQDPLPTPLPPSLTIKTDEVYERPLSTRPSVSL